MAIIQTIRDKYAKVAGGVVVLALVGFIIGGTDVRNIFGPSTTVASVNGKKIDIKDFDKLVSTYTEQYKKNNNLTNLDEATDANLKAQIWEEVLKDQIMADVYDNLGITVSKAELEDLISGDFLDPGIQQQFTNPQTGTIDRAVLEQNISNFRSNPDYKTEWEAFEKDIIKRRQQAKFSGMLSASVYVPKFLLDAETNAKNTSANIQFVQLPYALIPDSEANNTDEELLAYMNKHPKMFKAKQDSRSIEYVSFNIVPNQEDTAQVMNSLNLIKDQFAATTIEDSLVDFIAFNSSVQSIPTYLTKNQLTNLPNVEELWNAPINTVVGPFFDGTTVNLAKVTNRNNLPDSVVYRHIVVVSDNGGQALRSDADAKARMDSAIAQLNAGIAFDSVSAAFSDDQGLAQAGGSYTSLLKDKEMLPKDAGDFLFFGKAGEKKLVTLSQGQFKGYQYIEIISQSAQVNAAKIAFISKDLTPSSEAFSTAYSNATQFLKKINEGGDFNKTAQEAGVSVMPANNLAKNNYLIQGLGASRELAKWAYSGKENDLSPITTIGEKYVIARLVNVTEKNKIALNESTRQSADFLLKKEKKAAMILEKNKTHKSLDALSSSNNQTIANADSLSLANPFAPNIGNEPRLIGYAFHKDLPLNTLSKGVVGNNGIYYFTVSERNIGTTPENQRNIPVERKVMQSQIQASMVNQVINGMILNADIKDNRGDFY